MEIEFDKEIDAILRSAAKGLQSVELSSKHLDADEISSFAENVLPAKSRLRAIEHLADCLRCRKILIEISAFEAATPIEVVRVAEIKTEIPWYKKLFAFPNLAYSLGAVCLVFAGIIGFTVFQSKNSLDTVAKLEEKQTNAKGASSDGQEKITETPASNASIASNSAANTVANAIVTNNSVTKPQTNSATAVDNAPNLPQTSPTASAVIQPNKTPLNLPKEKPTSGGEIAEAPATESKPLPKSADIQPNPAAGASISKDGTDDKSVAQAKTDSEQKIKNESLSDSKIKEENDADEVTRSGSAPGKPSTTLKSNESAKRMAKDNKSESRQISGKTFRKIGGTWFDSAYGSQPQTNVSRGSADYKKLDQSLQNIGNSLNGTVIVVWKSKAYKIQ